jgi:chromosome segregation ATPase
LFKLVAHPPVGCHEDERMSFHQFLEGMSSELHELFGLATPGRAERERIVQLEEEIDRCREELEERQVVLGNLRGQLADKKDRLRWLATRVQVDLHVSDRTNAWRHALELDQVRQALGIERLRYHRLRQTDQAQRSHVRELERQLASLVHRNSPGF